MFYFSSTTIKTIHFNKVETDHLQNVLLFQLTVLTTHHNNNRENRVVLKITNILNASSGLAFVVLVAEVYFAIDALLSFVNCFALPAL